MSYYCDECGKNPVEQYRLWCSECQQREYDLGMEAEGRWYERSALCQKCNNAWGPDPGDKCAAYKMPLDMVARKKKCKRFKPMEIEFTGTVPSEMVGRIPIPREKYFPEFTQIDDVKDDNTKDRELGVE